jgi:hypothetical protein
MSTVRPTYQQKLFNDEELGTPLHDDIVRWTDRLIRERPGPILDALGLKYSADEAGKARRWKLYSKHAVYITGASGAELDAGKVSNALRTFIPQLIPEQPPPPFVTFDPPEWEPILKGRNGGIAGALDLKTTVNMPQLEGSLLVEATYTYKEPYSEAVKDISKDGAVILCDAEKFWWDGKRDHTLPAPQDLAKQLGRCVIYDRKLFRPTRFAWHADTFHRKIVFEAKTKIRAVGELIRQLKLYKTFEPDALFIVVAPAAEFKNETRQILIEQGFYVLYYQSNV